MAFIDEGVNSDETNLSTEQSPARKNARISRAYEHQKRPTGAQAAPRQRAQASDAEPLLKPLKVQEPTSSAPAPPERLRSSRQFRVVYERGLKFHTPYFSLFVLPKDGPVVRIGLTVTRKIGGAVVRNRCKRRLREIARRHTLPVLAPPDQDARGCDIIINAKPGLVGAGFAEIGEAYVKALARFRDTRPEALGEGGRRPNETDGDLPVAPL